MTAVVLKAKLPSVRHGLAAMLVEHGHSVVDEEEAEETPVWVLDAPDQAMLDHLAARRYGDEPRAAVILTDEPSIAQQLAHAGLRGWACMGRDLGPVELDLAVRAADTGLVLFDLPGAAAALSSASVPAIPPRDQEPLTPRELQVLQLVAQGLPNKGIAQRLGITENTAKFHVASLSAKLGAASRTEAVTLAARRGLIVL